jgi:hypothetical protein
LKLSEVSKIKAWMLAFICIMLLAAIAIVPAGAQVAHEDPANAMPGQSISTDKNLTILLGKILKSNDDISISLNDRNFSSASGSYYVFDQRYGTLKTMIWQLNNSSADYQAIGDNLDSMDIGLKALIYNSRSYSDTRLGYDNALLSGDLANVSIDKGIIRDRYANIINSYNDVRSNSTALMTRLEGKDVDLRPLQDSLNKYDSYINWLNEDYGSLGLDNNSTILGFSMDRSEVSSGDSVKFTFRLIDNQSHLISDSIVGVYIDNQLIGSNVTNGKGAGFIDYVVPSTIEKDLLHVQAQYIPANESLPRVYSNPPLLLHISGLQTIISMNIDRDTASYGDTVNISGRLSSFFRPTVSGRAVDIYDGDTLIGSAVTDDNGSYSYALQISPDISSNNLTLHAIFPKRANDIFLSSYTEEKALTMITQDTTLTFNGPEAVNLGDTADFNGTLFSHSGRPVSGVNVSLYIDDALSGNGTTDAGGAYSIPALMPDNATAGKHTVYASYDPGSGVSLTGSSSSRVEISFIDTGRKVAIWNMPMLLFKGDTLNLTGTLSTGAGTPIPDRALYVNVSDINATIAVTDGEGNFYSPYTATGGEAFGPCTVTVADASAILYTGQVYLVPYDKWKLSGALIISALIISGAILAFRTLRKSRRIKRQIKTDRSAHVSVPETAVKPMPELEFNMDNEISMIREAIGPNDVKTALTLIYQASRKAALQAGLEVTDSMTEEEFYHYTISAYPSVAEPLEYIINSYGSATYARIDFSASELDTALNYLIDINEVFKHGGAT